MVSSVFENKVATQIRIFTNDSVKSLLFSGWINQILERPYSCLLLIDTFCSFQSRLYFL